MTHGWIELHIPFVLGVVFLATFIRSAIGFGEALIAVPLLALRIPISTAAPLAVMLSITVAIVVLIQDWRKVHVQTTGWLLAPTVVGLPLGLLLLKFAHHTEIKACLAVILIAFSAYSLIAPGRVELREDSRPILVCTGLVAGFLGGAFGMNGTAVAVYGSARRWPPQQFRATLQGYFLPSSTMGLIGFWIAGLWTPAVTHYYVVSLLVALPAIFLGRAINRRLQTDVFFKIVQVGLLCVGGFLLIQFFV